MEIPELVRRTLGDEDIEAAVNLGDEDVVCFTPTRTIIYRGEGLLSDEGVAVYEHDVERLDVAEGRRKTTFKMQYVDRTEKFSVANGRGKPVLERLLTGVLGATGVIDHAETVEGVFQYSELTLVVTARRLLKHVGAHVWDEEYEEYAYESVTGLEFEEGSVATQIVLSVDGRPQRVKVPSDDVGVLRQTLEGALFAYHDVDSLQQLNDAVGVSEESTHHTETAGNRTSDSISLDDTISPLVGDDEAGSQEADGPTPDTEESRTRQAHTDVDTVRSTPASTAEASTDEPAGRESSAGKGTANESTAGTTTAESTTEAPDTQEPTQSVSPEEIEEMKAEIEELRSAVQRQSELLENQQETITTLIEELRRRH